MCRADVPQAAAAATAALLRDIRDALARQAGVSPEECRIGPVDLGQPAQPPDPGANANE